MTAVDRLRLPSRLAAVATRREGQAWLSKLPATISALSELWSLKVSEPFQPGGATAWVAPAKDRSGAELVVKVGWSHPEAAHEADGLLAWNGAGAVRLLAQAEIEGSVALLLERCLPGESLAGHLEEDQDVIISRLLPRLWIEPAPGHRFRPLSLMCEQWSDGFDAATAMSISNLDAGLIRAGMTLFRELPKTADSSVLLVTDLHAGNVLSAAREPWLVIDPKPYVGDRTYDPLQHMLNCERRLHEDPRGFAHRMADLLELNRDRLVLWLFARCVQESGERPGLGEVAERIAPA